MRFLRKGFNILVIVVVVIALFITALCLFVDPNRLKPIITAQIASQTGYQLAINGNLSWSFYPRVGVKADSMQVTAPKQNTPFITVQGVVLSTEFMKLLQGKSNLSGGVHIKQLVLNNLHAQNVSFDLLWENGVLTISPLSAVLYDGWMSGIVHGKDLNKSPHWDWDVQFSRVQLKPLLRDLNQKQTKLTVDGVGQLRMNAETNGTTKDDMLRNLQGDVKYAVTKGAVIGIDLNYLVTTAEQLINRQPVSAPDSAMQTDFESFTGSMKVSRAIATTSDTVLVAPTFTVKTAGDINLAHQSIDYALTVIPQQLEKTKWNIPVLIIGSLQDPTIKLDMLKIKGMMATEQFEKIKAKAEDKLKELSPKIDNFLQKVLGD